MQLWNLRNYIFIKTVLCAGVICRLVSDFVTFLLVSLVLLKRVWDMTKRYKEAPVEPHSNQAIATRPRGSHSRKPFCPKWPTRRTSQIEQKCFHARFPNVRALQVKAGKLKQSSVQNQMATKLFWIRNRQRFPRDGNWLGVDRLTNTF